MPRPGPNHPNRPSALPSSRRCFAWRSPPTTSSRVYWWAYVHRRPSRSSSAIWLVTSILFGNYGGLRDAALADLGAEVHGQHFLQIACAYGNLTPHLQRRLTPESRLDIVDILPIQLSSLGRSCGGPRIALLHADAASLAFDDAGYDQVLLFFLLHEQPGRAPRDAGRAMRVVKPGGKVIVDYHRPARWHALRPLMRSCSGPSNPRHGPVAPRGPGLLPRRPSPPRCRSRPSSAGCTRSWC